MPQKQPSTTVGPGLACAKAMSTGWQDLITRASAERAAPVNAHTFYGIWTTSSRPARLECDDGTVYVVKGIQNGRVLVNEQIVAHLGSLVGAPVPEVAYVNVDQALIARQPELAHFQPGASHGSEFVPGCGNQTGIANVDGDNRRRFARLAVLFGWVQAQDHQFIYENAAPYVVRSVDHGHFFPGGPEWRIGSLNGVPAAVPDQMLVPACQLTQDELRAAAAPLVDLQDQAIARAVAAPLDDWGVSMEERVAVATYLARRRGELLTALGM